MFCIYCRRKSRCRSKIFIAVEDALEQLAEFPNLGKQKDFENKRFENVRMWHVKNYENYLIFYEVFEDRMEVIRVLHGSRDIEDLFS